MSSYIVDPAHIDYLVSAAVTWGGVYVGHDPVTTANATAIGADLLAENIASVRYRYADHAPDNLPGPIPVPCPADYRFDLRFGELDPVAVLKAIRGYTYQACEHPAWEASNARQFCDRLTDVAIANLPGYDEAAWEIAA